MQKSHSVHQDLGYLNVKIDDGFTQSRDFFEHAAGVDRSTTTTTSKHHHTTQSIYALTPCQIARWSVRSIIAATLMGNKRGAAAPKIVRWWFVLHPDRKAHRVGRGPQAHALSEEKDVADLPVDDGNRSA